MGAITAVEGSERAFGLGTKTTVVFAGNVVCCPERSASTSSAAVDLWLRIVRSRNAVVRLDYRK